MRQVVRSAFFVVAGIVGAVAVSSHATAAPANLKQFKPAEAQQLQLQTSLTLSNMAADGIRKGQDVATNGSLDGVPLLNGFRFRFTNGDHELRQISLLPGASTSANAEFFDKNYDDPFNMAASWFVLRGAGARGEIFVTGTGALKVALPAHPANTHVVLSGFRLSRSTDDYNIRLFGVWIDEAANTLRVSFLDDNGKTGSGWGDKLGNGGGNWVPNAPNEVVADERAAAAKLVEYTSKHYYNRPFYAHIQYAVIPNDVVTGEDYITGSGRSASSGKQFPTRAAIQGFEFYFDNSDHHIMDVGIMPAVTGSIVRTRGPALPTPADEFVEYQDKNRDDPVKFAIKFMNLK